MNDYKLLRAAADRLEDRALASIEVSPLPWQADELRRVWDGSNATVGEFLAYEDAEHTAAAHPGFTLLVAAWLRAEADEAGALTDEERLDGWEVMPAAVALARLVLGSPTRDDDPVHYDPAMGAEVVDVELPEGPS